MSESNPVTRYIELNRKLDDGVNFFSCLSHIGEREQPWRIVIDKPNTGTDWKKNHSDQVRLRLPDFNSEEYRFPDILCNYHIVTSETMRLTGGTLVNVDTVLREFVADQAWLILASEGTPTQQVITVRRYEKSDFIPKRLDKTQLHQEH